jgi:3,4-dihydroxy 2-butanone 4-phosphate synthase/GTP cyclohydrolase II
MNEYPTVEDLDYYPFNGIQTERKKEWVVKWEEVETAKQHLQERGESLIEPLGIAPLPTEYGDFTYMVFGDKTTGEHHEVLVYGEDIGDGENLLTRVHSACRTNEVFHAVNCECRKELEETFRQIQQEGRGIVVYLEQEGRGTGIAGKMKQLDGMFEWVDGHIEQRRTPEGQRVDTDMAYKEAGYPSECRDFTVAGEMLNMIGVKSVRLLTNNPIKIQSIEQAGITVTPVGIHICPDNEIIKSDLISKAVNLGHNIQEGDLL